MFFRSLLLSLLIVSTSGQAMQSSDTFTFKAVTDADLPFLFSWFGQPYIAELWKEPNWEMFNKKYKSHIASQHIFPFFACIAEKPIGYIKYHHVNNEDRQHFPDINIPEFAIGLDLFIGEPEYLGKGYGTRLLTEFIQFVKRAEPRCTTITIDPAIDNHRAIACYKKAGFETMGTYITTYGPTGEGPGPILLMMYTFPNQISHQKSHMHDYFLTPMDEKSRVQTREHVIRFYADELLKSGMCRTEEEALTGAKTEVHEEDPLAEHHFFHINSCQTPSPLGYVWYFIKEDEAFIEAIFLEKEYRGHGIGEQIIRRVESALKEQGLQSIKLYVFAHNKPAHGLYKKLGYEISTSYANDDQMIGFLMKKELNHD